MDPSIFAIVIGVLSCLIYIFLSGSAIAALVYMAEQNDNSDTDGTFITIGCLLLICYLTMTVISALMILGVRKRRSDLIAPWLILTLAGIVCSILNLAISGYKQQAKQIITSVVYILVDAAIWYPIYKLWKELRGQDYHSLIGHQLPRQPQAEQQPPTNSAAHAAASSTTGGYQGGSYPIAAEVA